MRTSCSLVVVPLCLLLGPLASHAFVDEENEAVVIEDYGVRRGRQFVRDESAATFGLSPLLAPPLYQPCLSKDGELGKCMSLKECYPYFKIFSLPLRDTWVMGLYDTCSYQSSNGRQVFGVCCHNSTVPELPPQQDVEDKEFTVDSELDAIVDEFPIEFSLASNCGQRTVKPEVTLYNKLSAFAYIVNGFEAIPHEFPFMAALMNRNRQFCGGSLIDEKHILTAAHCVAHLSKNDVQHLRVRLGDHNIKRNDDSDHQVLKVRRVIRHKGFSSSTLWNDVAILTLERAVTLSTKVQPICLAKGGNSYVNQRVTVAGWGTLTENGVQPDSLMKVEVEVWSNSRCKSSYGGAAPGGITSHMLCASLPNMDSCSGDSGGPLFICPYGGRCVQIGIVSWGIGCAQAKYPGVYTRVTEMMPWIEKIVADY